MTTSGVGLGSGADVGSDVDVGREVGMDVGAAPPHAFRNNRLNNNKKGILLISAPHSLVGGIIGEENALHTLPARGIWWFARRVINT